MRLFILLVLFTAGSLNIYSQSVNITPQLKLIEAGEIDEAVNDLNRLKSQYPDNPDVMFLDAVLTEDGYEALNKYSRIYNDYPKSRYADAALYRIFSYHYSLGYYIKADEMLSKLKSDYPGSPYIKAADRNIPDVAGTLDVPVDEAGETSYIKPEDYKYTVQAGAFLHYVNAAGLKNSLENDGYYSDINSKEVGGSILNVVTVGKFNEEKEADDILSFLKEKYDLQGRVVPINIK